MVTVVELMDQVLPGNDKRVVKPTQAALEEMGVAFHLGDAVERVERVGESHARHAAERRRARDATS